VPFRGQGKNSGKSILNAEYINDWRGSLYEDNDGRIWFVGSGDVSVLEEKDGRVLFHKVELNVPGRLTVLGIMDFRQARDGNFCIRRWSFYENYEGVAGRLYYGFAPG
jgi:hypothetical protein